MLASCARSTCCSFLLDKVVGKIVASPVRRRLRAFEAATHDPRAVQEALLRRILAHQADTDFGRDHHFGDIRTVADFRRHVPVAGYEYIEPYIDRVTQGRDQRPAGRPAASTCSP